MVNVGLVVVPSKDREPAVRDFEIVNRSEIGVDLMAKIAGDLVVLRSLPLMRGAEGVAKTYGQDAVRREVRVEIDGSANFHVTDYMYLGDRWRVAGEQTYARRNCKDLLL